MRGIVRLMMASVLPLALGAAAAGMAEARTGLYLGAGSASVSSSGGFDGTTAFVDSAANPTLVYLSGKLEPGSGSGYLVGWGLNRFFSVEYLASATRHKGSHQSQAGETDAKADIGFAGVRFNLPIGQRFEIFARGGMNQTSVSFDQYAAQGSVAAGSFTPTNLSAALYKGTGQSVGFGFEFFIKRLGIGFSQTAHTVAFKSVTGAATSATLDPQMSSTLTQSLVSVTFNFKGGK